MKKSICIFSANYLPNTGGVERYTYYLARELKKLGNDVTIVTSNVFDLKDYQEDEGIKIYRLPCFNLLNGRFPVLKCNRLFFKLNKKLKNQSFDLVIVNTRFYIHSLYGVRFAKKKKTKCITIEHGTAHLTVDNKFWDIMGHAFEHLITKFIKFYCKDFFGVSEACCEWSSHFKIKSKGILYNSIDLNEINYIMENNVEHYRSKYNIPNDSMVIAFTGRLVKEKGILNLIEAFNRLDDNCYLIIAGDGPLEEEIASQTNNRIIMTGKISFDSVISMLSESDIFCLPSESEGLSTSVLEAIATKCFVITTSRGGSKEIICDKNHGIIMEDNDPEKIYNALTLCINNTEYRKIAVENSYKSLEENFTWDKTTRKIVML